MKAMRLITSSFQNQRYGLARPTRSPKYPVLVTEMDPPPPRRHQDGLTGVSERYGNHSFGWPQCACIPHDVLSAVVLGRLDSGSRHERLCSLGAAAVPDLGTALLFIFLWIQSLNSGDLEYPHTQTRFPLGLGHNAARGGFRCVN
jgi:hypothetical protein